MDPQVDRPLRATHTPVTGHRGTDGEDRCRVVRSEERGSR
jgi:hypothetical protein